MQLLEGGRYKKTTFARDIIKGKYHNDKFAETFFLESVTYNANDSGTKWQGIVLRDVTGRIEGSNNGVDAARRLMKEINYVPMSRYRVIIIDECHRISSSAWDALLKTLEEPPKHVMFILCTTDETALPETIRSRAPVYRFESISAAMLSRHAKETARKHGIKISDNALNLLASYADESMRNVLSLLEQMSMQSKDITESDVEMLLGINHYTFTVDFIAEMLSGNLKLCMERLNSLAAEGRSVRLFAKDLMRTAVDMVLQKTGITPDNGNMEYLKLLGEEAEKHSMAQLVSLAEATAGLEKRMRKESDTYAMYGGIISIVKKLHKDAPCMGVKETIAGMQTEEPANAVQEELTAETMPDTAPEEIPRQMPKLSDDALKYAETFMDIPASDGINRNINILPDLEQALMDFMPDLKHEPQGRFDTGIPGYAEDAGISDDISCMETDAGFSDEPGLREDCIQPYAENGFIPSAGMEYTGEPSMPGDADDETGSYGHGDSSCPEDSAEYGTQLPGDEDDFDRRWEEARQNSTENNGLPLPPLNSPTPAKGFNIFGLPLGLGIPDMRKKQSFT